MAKVFLDTNYFIDAIHRKPEKQILLSLIDHVVYTSTLSFHIYCYTYKVKIPNRKVLAQRDKFQLVDFSGEILERALMGPTTDPEDNIQLHCAIAADCELFLTGDAKLLKLRFFGKTRIASSLPALEVS